MKSLVIIVRVYGWFLGASWCYLVLCLSLINQINSSPTWWREHQNTKTVTMVNPFKKTIQTLVLKTLHTSYAATFWPVLCPRAWHVHDRCRLFALHVFPWLQAATAIGQDVHRIWTRLQKVKIERIRYIHQVDFHRATQHETLLLSGVFSQPLVFRLLPVPVRVLLPAAHFQDCLTVCITIQHRPCARLFILLVKRKKRSSTKPLIVFNYSLTYPFIFLHGFITNTPDFHIAYVEFLCSAQLKVSFVRCAGLGTLPETVLAVQPHAPIVVLTSHTLRKWKWFKDKKSSLLDTFNPNTRTIPFGMVCWCKFRYW